MIHPEGYCKEIRVREVTVRSQPHRNIMRIFRVKSVDVVRPKTPARKTHVDPTHDPGQKKNRLPRGRPSLLSRSPTCRVILSPDPRRPFHHIPLPFLTTRSIVDLWFQWRERRRQGGRGRDPTNDKLQRELFSLSHRERACQTSLGDSAHRPKGYPAAQADSSPR